MIQKSHLDILNSTALAHIATIGPKGEPQSTPVWFDWDGENIHFSQTTNRQKYRNLKRDGRVAISIVDPQNPFHYLEIRGTVTSFSEDPDLEFINKMAKKYIGVDKYPHHQSGDVRIVVTVKPEHTSQM